MTPVLNLDGRDVVVAGLLVRDGRVLLGHRSPGRAYYPDCWDVPGGHVEEGEEPAAALRRELAEELGVDVDEPTVLPDATLLGRDVDFRLWEVRRWEGEATNRAPEEHDEVGWRTLADAVGLRLAHPGLRRILAAALGVEYWAGAVVHDATGRVLLRAPGLGGTPGTPGTGGATAPGGPVPCWVVAPGEADAATVRHGLERAAGATVHVPGDSPVGLVEERGLALAVWDVPWPEPGTQADLSTATPAAHPTSGPAGRQFGPELAWHEPEAARSRLAGTPELSAVVGRVLGWESDEHRA